MQTFLPYESFTKSAQCLDNKRLGKQRVEVKQILLTLDKLPWQCKYCKREIGTHTLPRDCFALGNKTHLCLAIKTPWYNHPAVKMWKGYERWLCFYGCYICTEWVARGFKDNLRQFFEDTSYQKPCSPYPTHILGNEALHASHRSNLLRKDPEHYNQFGWTESNDLPYVWPIRED